VSGIKNVLGKNINTILGKTLFYFDLVSFKRFLGRGWIKLLDESFFKLSVETYKMLKYPLD
jgi:hypothetical protein